MRKLTGETDRRSDEMDEKTNEPEQQPNSGRHRQSRANVLAGALPVRLCSAALELFGTFEKGFFFFSCGVQQSTAPALDV